MRYSVSVQMSDNRGNTLVVKRFRDGYKALDFTEKLAHQYVKQWKGVAELDVQGWNPGSEYNVRGSVGIVRHQDGNTHLRIFSVYPDPIGPSYSYTGVLDGE